MATLDWPEALIPQRAAIGSQGAGEQFRSPYNGTAQTTDFIAERWVLSVTMPQARRVNAGAFEAFAFQLRGGFNRVERAAACLQNSCASVERGGQTVADRRLAVFRQHSTRD